MQSYLITASVLLVGRALDLLSTWHTTPTFALEVNQWMRRIGWRWTIVVNFVGSLILPLVVSREAVVAFAVFSALLAVRNYHFSAVIASLGEGKYSVLVSEYYGKAKTIPFWSSVFVKCFVTAALGLFMMSVVAIDKEKKLWFVAAISRGLLLFAFFVASIEVAMRLSATRRRAQLLRPAEPDVK